MRICILTRDDLFPANHGAAVKIVRTAEHLGRQGAPAFIVTDNRDRYLRFVDGSVEEVAYRPRPRAAQEWPGISRAGLLSERLVRWLGYPEEEVFLYRPLFDPAWVLRALAVAQAEGCTVFQAEFPGYGVPAALTARLLRAAGRQARSSVVQHNVEWDRLDEFGHDVRWIRRAERAALSMVDDVIAVSADDRRRLVAAGVDEARVTVIPHGVDVGAFSTASGAGIRTRWHIPSGAPLLFFHGTLHYWPNTEAVRFLAEALLPRLLAVHPDLRVLISGLNPPRYYDHPAITYTGPVDDLPEHIAAADLCLCPVTAGGGTRLKLLEYMAAGKAVVSTTKGAEGIPCDDALVRADGVEPFAEAVLELLHDPSRREAIGAAAARFARRYDWSAVTAAYLGLYKGVGRGLDHNEHLNTPPVDAHLPARTPSKPLTLLLLINRGCNLRCGFCDLWDGHEHMPVQERLLPLLDDAAAIGTRTLVITGGEPFLHPGLFQAVAAARARGLAVNITTNGTRVEKRWDELIAQPPDSLSFSLDGLRTTHDRIRGQRGAFRKTLAALDRVVAHGGIATSVYFTATRDNVAELVAVWELAREHGAAFDFWPVNEAPDHTLHTPSEQDAWREAVEHIAARDPVVAGRRAFYDDAIAYHSGAQAGAVRCLGFVDQYGITYAGDLLPCCVWGGDGLPVGNVFDTPLRDLWVAPAVQAARRRLYGEGCTVGCFNHSLYEFTASTGEPFTVVKPRS